jgi:hypothetical protein
VEILPDACRWKPVFEREGWGSEASLGKADELADVRLGQMMTLLAEFGAESRIERDDNLRGLAAIRKAW